MLRNYIVVFFAFFCRLVLCGAALFLVLAEPSSVAADSADLATITERWATYGKVQVTPVSLSSAKTYLETLTVQGSWPDINYEVTIAGGESSAYLHLERLLTIANVARWSEDTSIRLLVKQRFGTAAGFWILQRPKSSNNWYNVIFAPNALGEATLIASPYIDQSCKDNVASYIKSVSNWPDLIYASRPAMGQNLLWMAKGQILAALLTQDGTYFEWCVGHLKKSFSNTNAEGVQPDQSFHQHGPQLYSGGYGRTLINDGAFLAAVLYQGVDEIHGVTENLAALALDGQQWFIFNNYWDYNAVGRDIVRDSLKDTGFVTALRRLASLKLARAAELESLVSAYERTNSYPDLKGSKYFWRSDTAVFRGLGWYASARCASTRTIGNESGNGEGIFSYHLGSGSTCFMKRGTEYVGIFPLWNWTLVPGVTCPYQEVENLPLIPWGAGAEGGSAFVGGLAKDGIGIAAMELSRAGVEAKKAWFFINNTLVCLGAGIKASSGRIVTSVDQCWVSNQTTINTEALAPKASKVVSTSSVTTVVNGGFVYRFPVGGALHIERTTRSAPWTRINQGAEATKIASGEVFRLWLDHGLSPNQASYAYMVEPFDQPSAVTTTIKVVDGATSTAPQKMFPEIFANNSSQQVVINRGRTVVQCVFWAAGIVEVPGVMRIETDTPVIVQATKSNGGATLSVANPLQDSKVIRLKVTLFDSVSGAASATKLIPFTFTTGPNAGASIYTVVSWP